MTEPKRCDHHWDEHGNCRHCAAVNQDAVYGGRLGCRQAFSAAVVAVPPRPKGPERDRGAAHHRCAARTGRRLDIRDLRHIAGSTAARHECCGWVRLLRCRFDGSTLERFTPVSILTAEEWNERYPAGTLALHRASRVVYGGTEHEHAVVYVCTASTADAGHVAGETDDARLLLLKDCEPLATDQQRLEAGWLPPEEVEKLRADLVDYRDVRADRDDWEALATAMEPVVEAARVWRAARYSAHAGATAELLVAAVEALDTAQPEDVGG